MANDVLVVASKVKSYIKAKADFKTSGETISAVSKIVETILEKAIEQAKGSGRKTVMARDVEAIQ